MYSYLITFTKKCKYSNLKGGQMNIYVGNMSSELTEQELNEAFSAYGQISSVKIIMDRYTGEPRGFGFVEMPEKNEAEAAIAALNGKELKGRTLTVNEARPRPEGFRGGNRGRSGGPGYGRSRWSR
jgi:RNA recognition motif-containing protein